MNILGTTKISYEIEQLLDTSRKYLIIVSPYLKLNKRLKIRLSDAFSNTENILIIYRENQLSSNELDWLNSFENLNLFAIENLHSKIYLNDEIALISSMNLYEYSQINNHEIGVKFEYNEDPNNYLEILNEIRIILQNNPKIQQIIDLYTDFSMGRLFWELDKVYTFQRYKKGSQELYEFICTKSREISKFKDFELYLDKTAILRSTQLGKKKYILLEKELKKLKN